MPGWDEVTDGNTGDQKYRSDAAQPAAALAGTAYPSGAADIPSDRDCRHAADYADQTAEDYR